MNVSPLNGTNGNISNTEVNAEEELAKATVSGGRWFDSSKRLKTACPEAKL